MFNQVFSFNVSVLNNVVKSEIDLFYLKSIELPFEWTGRLKSEINVKRICALLKYSGIEIGADIVNKVLVYDPARDESLLEMASRLEIVIRETDLQSIMNLVNTIRYVDQVGYIAGKFSQERISLKEIVQINKLLCERMVGLDGGGSYRTSHGVGIYPHEIPFQFEELVSWFNSEESRQVNTVIVYGLVLVEFLRIVPFEHYSTETALFLATSLMISRGYKVDFVAFEEEFVKHRLQLDEILRGGYLEGNKSNILLEKITGIVAKALEKAKSRVSGIENVSLKYRETGGKAVPLTRRQLTIMEELTSKEMVTIKEIREVLPAVSDDTILRDLKDLLLKKMIKKKGKTKGSIYTLGKTRV